MWPIFMQKVPISLYNVTMTSVALRHAATAEVDYTTERSDNENQPKRNDTHMHGRCVCLVVSVSLEKVWL